MSGDEIDRALDLLDQAREYLLDAAAAVEVSFIIIASESSERWNTSLLGNQLVCNCSCRN